MKRHFNYFVTMLVLCACFLSTVHAQQKVWGKTPKGLFEIIGNPQEDLRDQGSAYVNLADKASGDPSIWRAGDTNSIEAAYYLAECYVTGKTGEGGPDYPRNQKGFPPNRPEAYELAVPLYEKAAYFDYFPSLVKLSVIYADEKYTGKNLDKSLTYLIKAAKLGDKNSIEKLSSLFSATFPGVTDESQKYAGTEVLANGGYVEAQIELSKQLISKGTPETFDKAKQFLVPLAGNGNPSATTLLKEIEAKVKSNELEAMEKSKVAKNQEVSSARGTSSSAQINEVKSNESEALDKSKAAGNQVVSSVVLESDSTQVEEQDDQITKAMIIFWITFAVMLIMATIGAVLGVKNKAVIFIGEKDVIISFIACILFFICLAVALHPLAGGYRLLAAVLGSLILIFLARTPYLTNQKNVGKTIVVVPTKIIIPSLVMISYFLSFISGYLAIDSAYQAYVTPRYTRKQREEKLSHQISMVVCVAAAAFFYYAAHRLQGLVKKLVKENPNQVSTEEIVEAEIVE